MYEKFSKASLFLMFNNSLIKNIFAVAECVSAETNYTICSD